MTVTTHPPRPNSITRRVTITCVTIVLLISVISLFPLSLGPPRESARRVKCASNLRQLGTALLLYANAHDGHYPDTLKQLVLTGADVGKDVFVCPSSNDTGADGNSPANIAASFSATHPRRPSYLYLGKSLTTSAADATPLAAEPLFNHDNAGSNILFIDGHVDFYDKEAAQKILAPALTKNP